MIGSASGDSALTPEYQVKAAFLYNFIKFMNWPQQKPTDNNDFYTIGILGQENPFGSAFDAVSKDKIRDHQLTVKYFGAFSEIDNLKQADPAQYQQFITSLQNCHILFICSSEQSMIFNIIEAVKGAGVVTVSEVPQFLESGGAINFLLEKEKIVFEINLQTIGEAGIEIRSQLLRIAKRVIGNGREKSE